MYTDFEMTHARRGWSRRWIALGIALYAVLLVASPVLHHDLACHLKAPAHCDACTANPLGARVEVAASLRPAAVALRVDAPADITPASTLFAIATPGRAPPA